jgi:hypothetical protein
LFEFEFEFGGDNSLAEENASDIEPAMVEKYDQIIALFPPTCQGK